MRLSKSELKAIKTSVAEYDNAASIYLFGSRVDDNKRGGDIDLLVFSNKLGFEEKLKIKVKLKELIGDQKIDLIITKDRSNPFVDLVYDESIRIS